MSVRTTTVVATGLVVLTLVGVGTIFGESLAALITPGPAPERNAAGNAAAHAGPPGGATAPSAPTAAPAGPGRDAGGNAGASGPTPDGSS